MPLLAVRKAVEELPAEQCHPVIAALLEQLRQSYLAGECPDTALQPGVPLTAPMQTCAWLRAWVVRMARLHAASPRGAHAPASRSTCARALAPRALLRAWQAPIWRRAATGSAFGRRRDWRCPRSTDLG